MTDRLCATSVKRRKMPVRSNFRPDRKEQAAVPVVVVPAR
jgi:hypothetical protein